MKSSLSFVSWLDGRQDISQTPAVTRSDRSIERTLHLPQRVAVSIGHLLRIRTRKDERHAASPASCVAGTHATIYRSNDDEIVTFPRLRRVTWCRTTKWPQVLETGTEADHGFRCTACRINPTWPIACWRLSTGVRAYNDLLLMATTHEATASCLRLARDRCVYSCILNTFWQPDVTDTLTLNRA